MHERSLHDNDGVRSVIFCTGIIEYIQIHKGCTQVEEKDGSASKHPSSPDLFPFRIHYLTFDNCTFCTAPHPISDQQFIWFEELWMDKDGRKCWGAPSPLSSPMGLRTTNVETMECSGRGKRRTGGAEEGHNEGKARFSPRTRTWNKRAWFYPLTIDIPSAFVFTHSREHWTPPKNR